MSTTVPGAPAPKSGWMRIVLIASLAFNLLILGAVAGKILRHGGPGHGHDHRDGVHRMFHAVPEPRRAELKALLDADKAEIEKRRAEVARLRQAARDLIAKDTFDTAAVEAAVNAVMAARMELRQLVTKRFIAALARMTTEERRAFVAHRNKRWRDREKGDL